MDCGKTCWVSVQSSRRLTFVSFVGAEGRNLGPSPLVVWKTGLDLVHCATIAHPRRRHGTHVCEQRRIEVAELLAKFCCSEFKGASSAVDLDSRIPPDEQLTETRVLTPSEQLEARLGQVPASRDSVVPVQPPSFKTLKFVTERQVRHWMSNPTPVGFDKPLLWWLRNEAKWGAIAPAAKTVLAFGSGRASLERLFSKAIGVYGDKCRKAADIKRVLLLAHSAWRVGMPGYHPPDSKVSTAPQDEDDVEDGASVVKLARVELI